MDIQVHLHAGDEHRAVVVGLAPGLSLIERDEEAPRAPPSHQCEEIARDGVIVERDLAGVGTLVDYGEQQGGEIAALYTLTRFLGEGVGAELVSHALAEARSARMPRVFACTTSERVGRFFERQGFRAVATEALPRRKTRGYDPRRLAALHCFCRRP